MCVKSTESKPALRPMLSSIALVLACACGLLASCGAGSPQAGTSQAGSSQAGTSQAATSQAVTGGNAPAAGAATGGAVLAPPGAGAPGAAPFRFFSAASFWNAPVGEGLPLAANSAELVEAFDATVATEEQADEGPWIDTTSYSVPVYTVPANQPTVRVALDTKARAPDLQSAFDAVPLPPNAQPAIGTDSVLVVWQPSSERLWEFWRLGHGPAGWRAEWGGAMRNVASDPGVYGPQAWPGAKSWWGSSASSMAIVGGLITLEDLASGQINHALAMAIPDVRAGVYASPAQRDDGRSTSPLSLPEGTHLRLNPKLDLAALHLPHLTAMIAEAAQRYGIFIRDHARSITFYAQDPIPTGTDPYTGAGGYFEGSRPAQLLTSFPWSELQVVKPSLHRNNFAHRSRGGP